MELRRRHVCLSALSFALSCAGTRRYYLHSELPKLEADPDLAVAPGPWKNEEVPVVLSDDADIPDDLVLSTLKALMALPGAVDACDPNTGHPRPDATEYAVAIYRTPKDWRVSWPIRNLTGELASVMAPFGGVEDEDYGRDLPIFGFAHNHPCGTQMSSADLDVFPWMKAGEGQWIMVAYGVTPSGKVAQDSRGQLIPAWAWLVTGHRNKPRFYKWSPEGKVYRWSEEKKHWEFQAICQAQPVSTFSPKGLPPRCIPEIIW